MCLLCDIYHPFSGAQEAGKMQYRASTTGRGSFSRDIVPGGCLFKIRVNIHAKHYQTIVSGKRRGLFWSPITSRLPPLYITARQLNSAIIHRFRWNISIVTDSPGEYIYVYVCVFMWVLCCGNSHSMYIVFCLPLSLSVPICRLAFTFSRVYFRGLWKLRKFGWIWSADSFAFEYCMLQSSFGSCWMYLDAFNERCGTVLNDIGGLACLMHFIWKITLNVDGWVFKVIFRICFIMLRYSFRWRFRFVIFIIFHFIIIFFPRLLWDRTFFIQQLIYLNFLDVYSVCWLMNYISFSSLYLFIQLDVLLCKNLNI